jgi:hypothetical protein
MKTFADLPNLKVITSGPIPPNPAELLSSAEMKNLLQFLKGKYQHVVIDSPPAISFTDAAILSTLVDGVVLNGLKADSVEYGYYGYGYTYNYYSASEEDTSTPRMEEWEDVLSIHKTKD